MSAGPLVDVPLVDVTVLPAAHRGDHPDPTTCHHRDVVTPDHDFARFGSVRTLRPKAGPS